MERLAAEAMYLALHEERPFHDGTFTSWAKERSRSHPYGAMEGMTIGVSDTDLAPWDHFTTKRDASPFAPEEPPGNEH